MILHCGRAIASSLILLLSVACTPNAGQALPANSPSATPSPRVLPTRLLALLSGQLVRIDSCFRRQHRAQQCSDRMDPGLCSPRAGCDRHHRYPDRRASPVAGGRLDPSWRRGSESNGSGIPTRAARKLSRSLFCYAHFLNSRLCLTQNSTGDAWGLAQRISMLC